MCSLVLTLASGCLFVCCFVFFLAFQHTYFLVARYLYDAYLSYLFFYVLKSRLCYAMLVDCLLILFVLVLRYLLTYLTCFLFCYVLGLFAFVLRDVSGLLTYLMLLYLIISVCWRLSSLLFLPPSLPFSLLLSLSLSLLPSSLRANSGRLPNR